MFVLFNFFLPSLCGLRQSCKKCKYLTSYLRIYINIILIFCLKNAAFLVLCGYKRTGGAYPKGTLREKCKYLSYLSTFSESANISVLYIINIYVK